MSTRRDKSTRLISIDKACDYTDLSRRKLYDLIKSGKIVAKKVGTRTLIEKSSIDKFLDALPRLAS